MLNKKNIGAYIAPRVGIVPASRAAGTTNGTGIDRQGLNSCTLFVQTGASSGTPSAISLACKLQESSDDASADAYADITDAAITAITAVNTYAQVDVDLTGCERYVRAVMTPAFTGGSSPEILSSAAIIFGGADNLATT